MQSKTATSCGESARGSFRSTLGASWPWHEVTIDGVRLAYDDDGSGPPIVCLSAIGHGAGDFRRLRLRLRDRYRVLAVDWPGHGNSANDSMPASSGRYTELLEGFLTAVRARPVILIGNSIGGSVAVRFAASHPDAVRALVLANPGRLDPTTLMTPIVTRLMSRFFDAGARGAWWYPHAFAAYYRMVLPAPPAAEQRARIVASAREIAPVLAQAWHSFGQPDAEVGQLAARVSCPVLATWAKHDRINQLSRARAAIGRFPRGRLELFAAGHSPFIETPDEFEESVERFLVELQSDRAPCAAAT